MDDFLNFIRVTSTRLFGTGRPPSDDSDDDEDDEQRRSNTEDTGDDDGAPPRPIPKCIHVADGKWSEIVAELLEPKLPAAPTGIVFINPKFARNFYVPAGEFRLDYDRWLEYGPVTAELLAAMKSPASKTSGSGSSSNPPNRYVSLMQTIIRTDSIFVSLHVCSPVLALDKLCARCPRLIRVSFHYYYLDDRFCAYLSRRLAAHLRSVSLENSLGLTARTAAQLGALPQLAHLNLSGTDISERALAKLLDASTPRLESLNVANNCGITGQCLTHGRIQTLKRLNLRDCWSLTSARLVAMAAPGLPQLLELLVNAGVADDSICAIATGCTNLVHLDVSFVEFTYFDPTGANILSELGFASIGNCGKLEMLRLRHVGRLTDPALGAILRGCAKLTDLTLNVRYRHKLTDAALKDIAKFCPNLCYFEALHTHFIAKNCLAELAALTYTLVSLVLRGCELVSDQAAGQLLVRCPHLRLLILDGCKDVGERTLLACIEHARGILPTRAAEDDDRAEVSSTAAAREIFTARLICTAVDRGRLSSLAADLPDNLRLAVSSQSMNKVHYDEWDGQKVNECKLRDTFLPFYWQDFN